MQNTLSLSVPVFALLLGAACATAAPAGEGAQKTVTAASADDITEAEVLAAQQAWGEALVAIATTYDKDGIKAAAKTASDVLDAAYGYNLGPVLFKPTLTVEPQTFRTTREGALAYFVGGDKNYPKDTGFARKGWRSFKIDNAAIIMDDDVAMSMGKVSLTDKAGKTTVVDKSWGYKKDDDGNLRIVLHHSSLPYTGD
jgi:hypothetical protein